MILNNPKIDISPVTFTIDQIRSAIAALYTSYEEELRYRAEQYLLNWKNSESSLPLSIQLLQSDQQGPQVMFVASLVLCDFIQSHWEKIDDPTILIIITTITKIINENAQDLNQPQVNRLILVFANIVLLNFDYFQYSSALNPPAFLRFICLLYQEMNEEKQYLSKWGVYKISVLRLTEKTPFALHLLEQFSICEDWIELHCQLLLFVNDFPPFYQFFESVKTAAQNLAFKRQILGLCCIVLNNRMEDTTEDEQSYYMSFIQLVISTADLTLAQATPGDDDGYLFVVNSWSTVFDISEFFEECGKIQMLGPIFDHFFQILPQITQANDTFDDLLVNFAYFLGNFSDSDFTRPAAKAAIIFVSELVDQIPYFRNANIKLLINCIQTNYEEMAFEYVQQKIQNPTNSLFYILAAADISFAKKFAIDATKILLSLPSPKPPSSLYFIENVGTLVEGASKQLIELTLELFQSDQDSAILAIERYSKIDPKSLTPYIGQLLLLIQQDSQIKSQCALIVVLFKLVPFVNPSETKLPDFIIDFISQFGQNASNATPEIFYRFLCFVNNLIGQTPSEIPDTFKYSLYNKIVTIIQPNLLICNSTIQESFCIFFNLSLQIGYVNDLTIFAEWLCAIIPTYPVKKHFLFLENTLNTFPFNSLINYFINFDYSSNSEIASYIISFAIRPLVEWNRFSEIFTPQFLIQMLNSVSNALLPLNEALELFEEISQRQIGPDFAIQILSFTFTKIRYMYRKAIGLSLRILHNLIGSRSVSPQIASAIFANNYNVTIPGVAEFVSVLMGQMQISEEDEINIIVHIYEFAQKNH